MYSERPLNPTVVYTTDRSKAVVPLLSLFCVAPSFTLRGDSCLVLPCSLSMCFFCPFSILITLLGEEGAGLCAHRVFVCQLCTLVCVIFFTGVAVGCGFCLWLFMDFLFTFLPVA